MAYIFKQKFDVRELTGRQPLRKKIMIVEPEIYACALYAYHLSAANYFVKSCDRLDNLDAELVEFVPHLLLVDPFAAEHRASAPHFLTRIRESYPQLLIITIGLGADLAAVRNLTVAGINAHVDRKLTKPQDITAIVKMLLK